MIEPLNAQETAQLRVCFPRHRFPEDRFLDLVELPEEPRSGCWVWLGCRDLAGRGRFSFQGKGVAAHRWAYEHWIGPVPEGLDVVRVCGTERCVNPRHLQPATRRESLQRARSDDPLECRNGHLRGVHEVVGLRAGKELRVCRECRAEAQRRYRERRREKP